MISKQVFWCNDDDLSHESYVISTDSLHSPPQNKHEPKSYMLISPADV